MPTPAKEKTKRLIPFIGHRPWVFVCALVLIGMVYKSISADTKDRYLDLQLFTKVLNLVQQYYVEEVDMKKLIYGGIKGMLRELDPHTNFMSPEIYKEFESETSGEAVGLGVEITVKEGVLTIISPIEDTPAWKAGLKAGDQIVEINGTPTKGLSLVEAAQLMKGKKGTKVKLGVFRKGLKQPKQYEIVRGTVKIKSVKQTDLENGYLYIRLTSFIENSERDFKKLIDDHIKNHKALKGLILDLRKNPGGLLDQAVAISDLFLSEGVIVSTIGRNKKEVVYAKKSNTLKDFPMIVLVDEYSASASEIVAGALQDNKRALIMGNQSFGKGSVQSVVRMGDGSALKLTVAMYYTPSGRSIQAEGIKPDITVENLDSEVLNKATIKRRVRREKDIQGHLLSESEKSLKKIKKGQEEDMSFLWSKSGKDEKNLTRREKLLKNDYQVLQAYNYLKAWSVMESIK